MAFCLTTTVTHHTIGLMKLKHAYAALAAAPVILKCITGFIPTFSSQRAKLGSVWSRKLLGVSPTNLNMGFQRESGKESNMFDGPMSLLRERDACGVGFIFNGEKGGKKLCLSASQPLRYRRHHLDTCWLITPVLSTPLTMEMVCI